MQSEFTFILHNKIKYYTKKRLNRCYEFLNTSESNVVGDTNILLWSGPDSIDDPSNVGFLAGKGAMEQFFLQAFHFPL